MFRYCFGDVIDVFTQLYHSVDDGSHEHMLAYAWDHTAFQFGSNVPMNWLAAVLRRCGLAPAYHPEFREGGRYGHCGDCLHWNGPRWGCELGDAYTNICATVSGENTTPDDGIPDWVYDVDGAGTTGFVTNRSNRAY